MKEVFAFIRLGKINQTKAALLDAGFPAFTCRKVLGRGKKQIDFAVVETLLEEGVLPTNAVGEHLTEANRLIPKRMITVVVEDDQVKKAVETIIEANQTGNPGDGKVFVRNILENYQVRSGEVATDAY
jgi:nitrogen regulatory protein PII 2